MSKWFSLITGGIAGTAARYLLTGVVYHALGSAFPYGTLTVNLIGCFIIGFLASAIGDKWTLGENARILLVTGFCGAFTTFSAFMLETATLIRDGEMGRAIANISISVLIGLFVFNLGVRLGEIL